VLPELVTLGLVERREAPPSALFALIEDNVAGRLVRTLSRSREMVLEELGTLARQMDPTPVSTIVFGSLARGDADALSDVDVVLVRPTDVDEDHEPWASSAERWRTAARRLTGNAVQVIEIDEGEVARRLRRPAELWANVLREGVVVHGASLESLRRRRSA
jgi:predicted nucleotidyltransferase